MKKEISKLKKQIHADFEILGGLLTSEPVKSINIQDGDWRESATSIYEIFLPKLENFLKKVDKITQKLPAERKRRLK